MACADGNLETFKFLLKQPGIKLDQPDKFGNTPISVIAHGDNRHTMEELLDAALGESDEDEEVIEKYGKIEAPNNKYHVFISHVFNGSHSTAQALKNALGDLGVQACMNEDLVIESDKLESMIMDSGMDMYMLCFL